MAKAFLENLPEARFTESTLKRMYRLVDSGKTDEKFQKLVYSIVNSCLRGQWKQYLREIECIFDWLKKNVDYRRDPYNLELIQDVWATMDRKRGDCDDMAIWLASAAEILGAPARFVTVSTNPMREWNHVYVEVFVEGRWVPLDATVQWSAAGWEPIDGITARKSWNRGNVGLAEYTDLPMEGLGMSDDFTDDGFFYNNGNGELGKDFSSGFRQFNPTGIPNDVSKTFAKSERGDEIVMLRSIPSKEVNSIADQRKMPPPGGRSTSIPAGPIMSHPTPRELNHLIDRAMVSLKLDPDQWTGKVPLTTDLNPNAYLPQKLVSEGDRLMDLAGLGQSPATVAALSNSVVNSVAAGILPNEPNAINSAINLAVEVWASKSNVKLAEEQAKIEEAKARQAMAQAEALKYADQGVPIWRKWWFVPLLGSAAIFFFKGGSALFDVFKSKRRSSRYNYNPGGISLKKIGPIAVAATGAYLAFKDKAKKNGIASAAGSAAGQPTVTTVTATAREVVA